MMRRALGGCVYTSVVLWLTVPTTITTMITNRNKQGKFKLLLISCRRRFQSGPDFRVLRHSLNHFEPSVS